MLDANTFDFMYDKQSHLVPKLKALVSSNKLSFYITHIQCDEIDKMESSPKRDGIKNIIKLINVQIIPTSNAVIGIDPPSKHGFIGSRIDMAKIVSDNDANVLEKLQKTTSNPMGNNADLSILFTAVKENLDYLVTNDIKHFKKLLKEISKYIPNTLEIKPNNSLLTDF